MLTLSQVVHSQCAELTPHRLPGKVLGHVSLGHRALIVEENPSCPPKALSYLITTNLESIFQKVPPVWGGCGESPGLCIWCFREEPPCSELCLCPEFGWKSDRCWLKNKAHGWVRWKTTRVSLFYKQNLRYGPDSLLVLTQCCCVEAVNNVPIIFLTLGHGHLTIFLV